MYRPKGCAGSRAGGIGAGCGLSLLVVAVLALLVAGSAMAQGPGYGCTSPPVGGPAGTEICDLGRLDGGWGGGNAHGVSGDGRAAVGTADIGSMDRAFRWVEQGAFGGPVNPQLQDLGVLDGDTRSFGAAINGDGRVVVGVSRSAGGGDRAFRWVQGGTRGEPANRQMQSLGVLPGGISSAATGVDASGRVVVGNSHNRGFRWVEDGAGGAGMQVLGPLPDYLSSLANGVSADGRVVVGESGGGIGQPTRAMRWVALAGEGGPQMQDLGALDGGFAARAHATDDDGSVVVGDSRIADGWRAFRWVAGGTAGDPGNPQMQNLGTLTGGDFSQARGVSADGRVVVGMSHTVDQGRRAFRWIEGGTGGDPNNPQMQDLGLLPGGSFALATGVSADGRTVVGLGDTAAGCCSAFIWREESGIIPVRLTATRLDGPEHALLGRQVQFAASVTAEGARPDGRVSFRRDGTEFAAASLDGQGMARVAFSALPLGLHRITAHYDGSAGFRPSVSAPLMLTIIHPRPAFSGGGAIFALTGACTPVLGQGPHPVVIHFSPSELGGRPSGVSLVWRDGAEHLALWGPMLPSGQFFGGAGRGTWTRFVFYPTRPLVRVVQRQITRPAGGTGLDSAEELVMRLRVQNFAAIQGCSVTIVATLRRAG